MSNNSNSSNNSNRATLQGFKTEVANSLNVNLKQGYNGDITAREAGSIGGEMVKRMIAYAENNMNTNGNMMKYHQTTRQRPGSWLPGLVRCVKLQQCA